MIYKIPEHKRLATGGYTPPKVSNIKTNLRKGKRSKPNANKDDIDDAQVIKKRKGGKPLHFSKGGLHRSTGTPAGQKIPKSKLRAALSGKLGPKAKKQANMAKNVFHVSTKKKGRMC